MELEMNQNPAEIAVETTNIEANTQTSETPVEKPVITPFERGDLYVKCACGEVEYLEKGVKNGIQIQIPCTDYHKLTLACKKCGANITIGFVESDIKDSDIPSVNTDANTSQEEVVANEQVQENSI
jgi:hypothetical protein